MYLLLLFNILTALFLLITFCYAMSIRRHYYNDYKNLRKYRKREKSFAKKLEVVYKRRLWDKTFSAYEGGYIVES